jgi:hypothetical protein
VLKKCDTYLARECRRHIWILRSGEMSGRSKKGGREEKMKDRRIEMQLQAAQCIPGLEYSWASAHFFFLKKSELGQKKKNEIVQSELHYLWAFTSSTAWLTLWEKTAVVVNAKKLKQRSLNTVTSHVVAHQVWHMRHIMRQNVRLQKFHHPS